MTALESSDLRRAYRRGQDVLKGVTFSVAPGDVVGLLGRNGAGKTTLIRIAMGMLAPQSGHVRVLGLDPRREAVAVKRRVGYVAEDQVLPPFMRIREIFALHRRLFPTWDESLARELQERFELDPAARIKTLSKGMARRVALVCAVAHRPELLLLDEPASGLDPLARREFLETAIRLLNETGCAIVFSSHHMTDVERMAERIVMLHDGRVLIDEPLDNLREGFSLALVPRGETATRERLLGLAGCVGVREHADDLRMILQLDPAEARRVLHEQLGLDRARCQAIPLEEMFVELAGGTS